MLSVGDAQDAWDAWASTIAELLSPIWAAIDAAGPDWVLSFASIPVVASLIGYVTNLLAIQMTFLPLEYVGCYEAAFRATGFSLGWQGIIPANSVKIANKAVTIITSRLINVQEVFGRLDKTQLIELMRDPLLKSMERVLDRVAGTHFPDVWEAMPLLARHELALKACEESEPYIAVMIEELSLDIERYLDLYAMAVEELTADKALMNEIFKRCGDAEFRFIENSGLYFGFLLGCVQAVVWWLLLRMRSTLDDPSQMPLWWFLPAAGALCGYITNALALGIIFHPIEPIHFCGIRLLGLFLQRQAEVSEEFAAISASRIITARNCWDRILFGNRRERFESMVIRVTTRAINEQVGMLRPFIPLLIGAQSFQAARQQAAQELLRELPSCLQATYEYSEEAMDIQRLLASRMRGLPSAEFERVLHPAFEEDEWKLIAVGGLLGLAVGFFQLLVVFKDDL